MTKQVIKVYFVELHDDLILLEIISFHKQVSSLVNKSSSAIKHNKNEIVGRNKMCFTWQRIQSLLQGFIIKTEKEQNKLSNKSVTVHPSNSVE